MRCGGRRRWSVEVGRAGSGSGRRPFSAFGGVLAAGGTRGMSFLGGWAGAGRACGWFGVNRERVRS
jgi:hypothetical protein